MKLLYRSVGLISLATGILGAFLPLLPTTCFLLLSAWCFARSSPRWHARLLGNRLTGAAIRHWQCHRCIPAKARFIAIASMVVSGGWSLWVIEQPQARSILVIAITTGICSVLSVRGCRIAGPPPPVKTSSAVVSAAE